MLRAAFAGLYAHWEGFVKEAVCSYADLVRSQRPTFHELDSRFLGLALARRLPSDLPTGWGRTGFCGSEVERLRREWYSRASLLRLDNELRLGNLDFAMLCELLAFVGAAPERYRTHEKPVVERLVEIRHPLAHGRWKTVSTVDYDYIANGVQELMEWFATDVENASVVRSWRR
jgi:hypothetical protein